MTFTERAIKLSHDVNAALSLAVFLPAGVRRVITDLAALVKDMAHELDTNRSRRAD